MKRTTPLVLRVVLVLFLLWLEGGDVLLAARLPSAAEAAVVEAPDLLVSLGLTALVLVAAALVVGELRGRATRRTRLLSTLALATVLIADLIFLSGSRAPASPARRVDIALQHAFDTMQTATTTAKVLVVDPRGVAEAVSEAAGPAPFFSNGTRRSWVVEVRRHCTGPASEVRTSPPATIITCVDDAERKAWVSVVSLSSTFGGTTVVSLPEAVEVPGPGEADEEDPPDDPDAPAVPQKAPMWGQVAPDAGATGADDAGR